MSFEWLSGSRWRIFNAIGSEFRGYISIQIGDAYLTAEAVKTAKEKAYTIYRLGQKPGQRFRVVVSEVVALVLVAHGWIGENHFRTAGKTVPGGISFDGLVITWGKHAVVIDLFVEQGLAQPRVEPEVIDETRSPNRNE